MSPLRYFSTKKSYSCCYEQLHVYLYNENNKYKVHVGKKNRKTHCMNTRILSI